MTAETLNLSRQKSVPVSMRSWVLATLLVVAALAALLINNASLDTTLWRGTRWLLGTQDAYVWSDYKAAAAHAPAPAWYQTLEPPLHGRLYKRTENLWRLFRDLGEPLTTLLLMALLCIYDRRRWRAAALLAVITALTGLLGMLIRMTDGRLRPNGHLPAGTLNEADNYWTLFRGFHGGSDLSFPSGHATLAFATAAVLIYLSPRGKYLFLTLAVGCALARVVMQAHFYSDVIFGAFLGFALTSLLVRPLDALLAPPSPSLS